MTIETKNNKNDYPLSHDNYLYMKMLAARCGIDVSNYNRGTFYNRLIKRLTLLNLNTIDEYCDLLRVDLEEEVQFIDLITNATTSFFRTAYHFDYLEKEIIPAIISKQSKLRIWCAGCSTGEEAYSISMSLHENIPNINQYDIKILATDINSTNLMIAEEGIYDIHHIKGLSIHRKKSWFKKLDKDNTKIQINQELKKIISFRQLNLMSTWPIHGPLDAIFCRNVLIYFNHEIGQRILLKFFNLLEPNGILFLGHSENLHEQRHHFQVVGKTIFKKYSK